MRQRLPTQGAVEYICHSINEVQNAITSVVSRFNGNSIAYLGAGAVIVIASPINVSTPIIIPAEAVGLTIISRGRVPITPSGTVASLFDVRAERVTICGLYVPFVVGSTFSVFAAVSGTTNRLCIDDCEFTGGAFVACAASTYCFGARITNNYVEADGTFCEVAGRGWVVQANVSISSVLVVTVAAVSVAGGTCIVGNSCFGDDITTTVGDGYNTISANTNTGAITAHATDDTLGGNT